MKKKILYIVVFFTCIFFYKSSWTQTNIFPSNGAAGIGTLSPNASSLLDMVSTTKGLLIPRMTTAQRNAIVSPATGLLIYQTNGGSPGFYYYDGSDWTIVSKKGWNLTGNSGTDPLTNFIGTKDAQPLIFKVNNLKAGYIDYDNIKASTSFGYQALLANTTGTQNTAVGYNALSTNTTGFANAAVGNQSLLFNTTGYQNTALGFGALRINTTGYNNTASGLGALYLNTMGNSNTGYGYSSLASNTTGNSNTAAGIFSMLSNTTGYSNVAIGVSALSSNTTKNNLVAIGDSALYNNGKNAVNGTDATANTAIGSKALYSNTAGAFNTAIGFNSLYNNTTGNSNTAIGWNALLHNSDGLRNTSTGVGSLVQNINGNYNTTDGWFALGSNKGGSYNTAYGAEANYINVNGSFNTSFGTSSLYSSLTSDNTAIGYQSIFANINGDGNTAVGKQSMKAGTAGFQNTATGYQSLYNNTGNYNTGLGTQALYTNTNGNGNLAVGSFSGFSGNTVAFCTFVGYGADVNSSSLVVNATAIGWGATVDASSKVSIGNSSVTSIGGYANWTNISDGRVKKNIKANVPGLAFINKLQPVTYNLNLDEADKITKPAIKKDNHGKSIETVKEDAALRKAKEAVLYSGFVAQDVEKAAKSLNYDFSGVDVAKNEKGLYGLRYAEFVVPLLKAVQELSAENDQLKKRLEKIETLLAANTNAAAITSHFGGLEGASLDQNIPNPFSNSTIIEYTLPQKFTTAQMVISDLQGRKLRSVNVSGSGKNQINVQALSLSAGTYNYTLVINGKSVSTKQMVIIK